MRCYYVLVHGRLNWQAIDAAAGEHDHQRPSGFYCHRYVLAHNEHEATESAFRRVRRNLDQETNWVGNGSAVLNLEAEEVTTASIHKLLMPENRGHAFYEDG